MASKLLFALASIVLPGSTVLLLVSLPVNKFVTPRAFNPADYAAEEAAFRSKQIAEIEKIINEYILPACDEYAKSDETAAAANRVAEAARNTIDKLRGVAGITERERSNSVVKELMASLPAGEEYTADYPDLDLVRGLLKSLLIKWEPDLTLAAKGRLLYRKMCMTCHGLNGDAVSVTPELLTVIPRDFTGRSHKFQKVIFKFTRAKQDMSAGAVTPALDSDLRSTIRDGLPGTPMPGFSILTDSELDALVEYVKTFGYVSWKYGASTEPAVQVPDIPDDLGSNARIENGRKLYASNCKSCHGDIEFGGEPDKKDKNSDWFDKMGNLIPDAPRNFAIEPLRKGKLEDLFATIKLGIKGTPMPANSISDNDTWDMISYVLYLRKLASEGKLPVR